MKKRQWGYYKIRFRNGLSLFAWDSSGNFVVASYHPPSSITWLWSLSLRWPEFGKKRHKGWWKSGRWVSPVKRGWSIWALGFGISWSSQERVNWSKA